MKKSTLISLFFLLLLLVSCSEKRQKKIIGFSQCINNNEWRVTMVNEMNIELSFYEDVEVVFRDANGSSKKQVEQIRELMDMKVDVLIISPNESEPLTEIAGEAYNAGIPTIIVDRSINSDQYTCFIGADNKEIGQIAGEYAIELTGGKARILELWGQPGSSPAQGRHRGFANAIKDSTQMLVVQNLTGDWMAENITTLLQDSVISPDVNLVYGHNDEMALSVYEFMKQKGMNTDSVYFIGIDALMGEDGGIRAVAEGKLNASFLYPSGGDVAIQKALEIIEGKTVEKNIKLNTSIINSSNAKTLELQSNQMLNYQSKISRQQTNLENISKKYNIQRTFLSIIGGLLVVMVLLVVLVFFAYRTTNRINKELNIKNIQIENQKEELGKQRDNLVEMNSKIEEQNKEILSTFNNLKTLSNFGKQLTAMLDFQSLNQMIYQYLQSLANVSSYGIGLYNEKTNQIEFRSFFDDGEQMPTFSKTLDRKNSFSSWTWKNQKTLYINDVESEYKHYTEEFPLVSTKKIPMSVIQVPLTVEKNKIGLLVANSYSKNAYNEKDVTNIETIASYLAIALDNANAYKTIENKNKKILESIYYAETIQKAILPSKNEIRKIFDSFILYLPRDIVSGDFYWFANETDSFGNSYHFLAVVDCTGHGVPGAFMSMIGVNMLNQIVKEKKIFEPSKILNLLNLNIFNALNQGRTNNDDGMDVCLCRFQKNYDNSYSVIYSGAKRPMIYLSPEDEKVQYIKGSTSSIGGKWYVEAEYKENHITLPKGTTIILTSDGIFDQIDDKRKRYTITHFKELLESNRNVTMSELLEAIEIDWLSFKRKENQIDDVTMVGIAL